MVMVINYRAMPYRVRKTSILQHGYCGCCRTGFRTPPRQMGLWCLPVHRSTYNAQCPPNLHQPFQDSLPILQPPSPLTCSRRRSMVNIAPPMVGSPGSGGMTAGMVTYGTGSRERWVWSASWKRRSTPRSRAIVFDRRETRPAGGCDTRFSSLGRERSVQPAGARRAARRSARAPIIAARFSHQTSGIPAGAFGILWQ